MMKSLVNAVTSEFVRFTGFLESGAKSSSKVIAGAFALALCLLPCSAFAQSTTFGDSAKTELEKITPQVTTVGLAIVAIVGVIVAVYVVMRMMKKV